ASAAAAFKPALTQPKVMASRSLKPLLAGAGPATGADCSCGTGAACCASDTVLHPTSATAIIPMMFLTVHLGIEKRLSAIRLFWVRADLPTVFVSTVTVAKHAIIAIFPSRPYPSTNPRRGGSCRRLRGHTGRPYC